MGLGMTGGPVVCVCVCERCLWLWVHVCACCNLPSQACRGRPSLGRPAPERERLWPEGWGRAGWRGTLWCGPGAAGTPRAPSRGWEGSPAPNLQTRHGLWCSPRSRSRGQGSRPGSRRAGGTCGGETGLCVGPATSRTWGRRGPRKPLGGSYLGPGTADILPHLRRSGP